VKKAIEQGNSEGARIYAQNAIREKNQALNYLRLSSRIDAVASRVETAVRMGALTKSMSGVVKGMDKVLKNMDTDQISQTMDKFEKQFEDMDVKSAFMEDAMGNSTSSSTPVEEVDSLIQMVGDEHGLAMGDMFEEAPTRAVVGEAAPAESFSTPENDLAARLAALKS
jgi:charged multivesicular body protein 1